MTRVRMMLVVGLMMAWGVGAQAQGQDEEVNWTSLGPWTADRGDWTVEIPFQIFDNVYYVGDEHTSSYLITTSRGLVLIDTTSATTVNGTLHNIRQLGFDPNDIDYVFITHAHDVHYGGAARIKAETGATICMSAPDRVFLEGAGENAHQAEYHWTTNMPPPRDREIVDGEVITSGDSMFKMHVTPGHTPGATSFEFIAYDGDESYRVLTPGGLGLSFSSEWTEEYINSYERLKELGPWDVVLSNHPFMVPGNLFKLMLEGADRATGDPHPVVQGPAAIDVWFDAILEAARKKAAAPPHGHQSRY